MQTNSIAGTPPAWSAWSGFLHKYGLENLTAFILEAGGPLSVFGAQLLHFTGPFLHPLLSDARREDLADLLEDREEALAFAAFLREETPL